METYAFSSNEFYQEGWGHIKMNYNVYLVHEKSFNEETFYTHIKESYCAAKKEAKNKLRVVTKIEEIYDITLEQLMDHMTKLFGYKVLEPKFMYHLKQEQGVLHDIEKEINQHTIMKQEEKTLNHDLFEDNYWDL